MQGSLLSQTSSATGAFNHNFLSLAQSDTK